jgi:hypothetical protein
MSVNCLGFHQSEPQENATRFLRQAALAVELARSLVMLADNEKDCLSRDAGSSGCGCHCTMAEIIQSMPPCKANS